jgi:oleate hydratase
MEAVYTLLDIDRGVPEVFNSCYDIRQLLDSTVKMMDGKKITQLQLPFMAKFMNEKTMKLVSGTIIGDLLKRYNMI